MSATNGIELFVVDLRKTLSLYARSMLWRETTGFLLR